MLHVTNGDSAAQVLRDAGLEGEVLPWRDVLHEGPVPGALAPDALRRARARFLAGWGGRSYEEVLSDLDARDARLLRAATEGDVVLWFEHDLYDQLQLLQVLGLLREARPAAARVSLICEAEYVGRMSAERVRELFAARQPVTAAAMKAARKLWDAFTAEEPRRIARALKTDLSALPYAGPALRRHLEEFPAASDGLSRSERQALQAFAEGPTSAEDAYVLAHHAREEAVFLGDVVFAAYLERLSVARVPLLTFESGEAVRVPQAEQERDFWRRKIVLTDAGRAVLAGLSDHVRLNGIDRWLGGVHLEGRSASPWRWDATAGDVVPAA